MLRQNVLIVKGGNLRFSKTVGDWSHRVDRRSVPRYGFCPVHVFASFRSVMMQQFTLFEAPLEQMMRGKPGKITPAEGRSPQPGARDAIRVEPER